MDNTLEDIKTSYQYVFELREKIEETLKIAREELEKAQRTYKVYYDRSTKRRTFSAGDKVLILLSTESNKLLMRWRGPYSVVLPVGKCDYRINVGGKVKIYHDNLLKGFVQRPNQTNGIVADEIEDCSRRSLLRQMIVTSKMRKRSIYRGWAPVRLKKRIEM